MLPPPQTRRHLRRSWQQPVRVRTADGIYEGESRNLCEGGIGVAIEQRVPAHDVIIEIDNFVSAATIVFHAVLRHRTGGVSGYEFTSVTPVQARLLHRVCQALPTQS